MSHCQHQIPLGVECGYCLRDARIAQLEKAMIDPRPLAKAWWSAHSSPYSNSFDYLPVETQQRCMLEALEELGRVEATPAVCNDV